MANGNVIELDSMQRDFLTELGNIGGGCAVTSLSVLLNSSLTMAVPKVRVLEFSDLTEIFGGADSIVVAVLSPIVGDLNGMMMFVLEREKAKRLADALVKDGRAYDEFTDMDLSAIKEIGNIIISTYLGSLESLTRFKIRTAPPEIGIDMAGAILSVPAIEFGNDGDRALVIEADFVDEELDIDGHIILLSEVHSYDKMYKALGVE